MVDSAMWMNITGFYKIIIIYNLLFEIHPANNQWIKIFACGGHRFTSWSRIMEPLTVDIIKLIFMILWCMMVDDNFNRSNHNPDSAAAEIFQILEFRMIIEVGGISSWIRGF